MILIHSLVSDICLLLLNVLHDLGSPQSHTDDIMMTGQGREKMTPVLETLESYMSSKGWKINPIKTQKNLHFKI